MKRNLAILILTCLLLMPVSLLAAEPEKPPADPPITSLHQLVNVIDKLGEWLFAIIFALAVIFVLVSAFQFLTAAGNPEKITSARQILIYALIAVAVAVIAWGLPKLIKKLVGSGNSTDPYYLENL